MRNILLFCFVLIISLNAKEFYYSFIDENRVQISEFKKKKILAGNYRLEVIKRLVREGQLEDAYKQILKFKEHNKLKILDSSTDLLYADILYKRGGSKFSKKAIKILTDGINNSKIHKENLLEAYRLLVVLNIKINKPKDARYFAKSIGRIFDNPLSQAYGQIALAQIDSHKRLYKQAIKTLYKILVKTNDIIVATVVADELFDVYMLDGQKEKAYDLVGKVLKKNIKYYANDSFLALKKVDKLINANMPTFAIDILKMLLNEAVEQESVYRFKFKLANNYMKITGREHHYMLKAKELYKDLMTAKKKVSYYSQVKMAMDEILMREGKIVPSQVASRYSDSESMQQKVLLQELLNDASNKKYDLINKMKRVYIKISDTTAKRFGYKNITEVFDNINSNMIKYYLQNDKCIELSDVLYTVSDEALEELIRDKKSSVQLFDCLMQSPDLRSYEMAKNALSSSRDANIYFALEKVALLLDKVDDAYSFIHKIDMINDPKVKEKEFLYRFLVYGKLNNTTSMDQFFQYTSKHPEYIKNNENNPLIIDFYYQYYLYLHKKNNLKEALVILNKLNKKQIQMNAFVYSPFVELELLKEFKLEEDYENGLNIIRLGLKHPRSITDNQQANLYYEMAKIYEKLDKKARYEDSIHKCKELKKADNLYKKMCDKL